MLALNSSFTRQGLSMSNKYSYLLEAIDDVIRDKAQFTASGFILNVNELDTDELTNIIYLCLENNNRENIEDCFTDIEDINSDNTCALLSLLIDNSLENKIKLVDLIIKRTINKYKNYIQELIDERCEYNSECYADESGMQQYQDEQTGCYEWR